MATLAFNVNKIDLEGEKVCVVLSAWGRSHELQVVKRRDTEKIVFSWA
jgi:hypothetical protein